MDRLIYTAMTGANAAAHRQSVLSNNLANVSTNGFRAELSTYRAVPLRGDGATTRVFALEATSGHLDAPGPSQTTGRALDVRATGNGWFAVQARQWVWAAVFAVIAVAWNPVFPFGFDGLVWSLVQPAAAIVFLVAGAMIKTPRD